MATLYGVPATIYRGLVWVWKQPIMTLIWFLVAIAILAALTAFIWAVSPFAGSIWLLAIISALLESRIRSVILDIMFRRWAET